MSMLEKSFCLYKSLNDGTAIKTSISTGMRVHATSKTELCVVLLGFALFLALNFQQTYARSKKTNTLRNFLSIF